MMLMGGSIMIMFDTPGAEFTNMLGLYLISAWLSNPLPSKAWDEITYPFFGNR